MGDFGVAPEESNDETSNDAPTFEFGWDEDSNEDFEGKTIKEAREHYAGEWKMEDNVAAYSGKQKLPDNHKIKKGEKIEFHRVHGEKG